MKVTERYTLAGPNHIDYEATIEDPLVLTEPFTIKMPIYRRMELTPESWISDVSNSLKSLFMVSIADTRFPRLSSGACT